MPIAITNQFNQSLVNLLSNSNTKPAAQCLALVQSQGKRRRITSIHAGYTPIANFFGAAAPNTTQIIGRITVIQGAVALDPNTDRAAINSGYTPFDAPIDFGQGSFGKVIFDQPIYNRFDHSFADDESLIFQPGDVITVLLSNGFTAQDVSVSNYGSKLGYLTVLGHTIEDSPDKSASNFKFR